MGEKNELIEKIKFVKDDCKKWIDKYKTKPVKYIRGQQKIGD